MHWCVWMGYEDNLNPTPIEKKPDDKPILSTRTFVKPITVPCHGLNAAYDCLIRVLKAFFLVGVLPDQYRLELIGSKGKGVCLFKYLSSRASRKRKYFGNNGGKIES